MRSKKIVKLGVAFFLIGIYMFVFLLVLGCNDIGILLFTILSIIFITIIFLVVGLSKIEVAKDYIKVLEKEIRSENITEINVGFPIIKIKHKKENNHMFLLIDYNMKIVDELSLYYKNKMTFINKMNYLEILDFLELHNINYCEIHSCYKVKRKLIIIFNSGKIKKYPF